MWWTPCQKINTFCICQEFQTSTVCLHQWIQGYFRKAFCWFSREVFVQLTNPIPHFKSFHMGISDFYSDQLNSWQKTKHDFEPFIWLIRKDFCFWEFLKSFSTKYLHLRNCFELWRYISILVKKTATRAWIRSISFSAKIELQLIDEFSRIKNFFQVKIKCMWYQIKTLKKFYFGCKCSKFIVRSIFDENWLEWIHAVVAVFRTNIEMSLDYSKEVPKWRYLVEKKFKIFQKQNIFLIGQINDSKLCFVLCLLLSWSE